MEQNFFTRESGKLSYSKILKRLQAASKANESANARHADIFRQIVERCSIASGTNPAWQDLEHNPFTSPALAPPE